MKLAIVHERLDVVGGAEKVILALHRLFPNAPIYTSFVDYDRLTEPFRQMDIRTSYMQNLPSRLKRYSDKLLPFYMMAFQEFDLSDYDVVLSSSYVAAKSVLTPSDVCHICYCHTPMRFAWDLYPKYIQGAHNPLLRNGLRLLLQYFRLWDVQTAHNVDYFISNSETVRQRIRKHYRRESEIIYPPVETCRFRVSDTPGDYYLAVSRLVPYKRIDLAVEAFSQLGRRLVVIGEGREMKTLKAKAGPNVEFLGWQSDEVVARYLSEAKALIFPGEEDFGILPVEAQAAGTPVIAYGKGGALETVKAGRTGHFFPEQTSESLQQAVLQFEMRTFDRHTIAEHARQFDETLFLKRIKTTVQRCYDSFQSELAYPRPNSGLPLELTKEEALGLEMESRAAR